MGHDGFSLFAWFGTLEHEIFGLPDLRYGILSVSFA